MTFIHTNTHFRRLLTVFFSMSALIALGAGSAHAQDFVTDDESLLNGSAELSSPDFIVEGGLGIDVSEISVDLAEPASCGNGVREAGEDCDGTDLSGATCASLGAGAGSLRCIAACRFDTSACKQAAVAAGGGGGGGGGRTNPKTDDTSAEIVSTPSPAPAPAPSPPLRRPAAPRPSAATAAPAQTQTKAIRTSPPVVQQKKVQSPPVARTIAPANMPGMSPRRRNTDAAPAAGDGAGAVPSAPARRSSSLTASLLSFPSSPVTVALGTIIAILIVSFVLGDLRSIIRIIPLRAEAPCRSTLHTRSIALYSRRKKLRGPSAHTRNSFFRSRRFFVVLFLFALLVVWGTHAQAIPNTLVYSGRILNPSRQPVTSPVILRFSLWKTADWISGDATGGAINPAAAQYGGWAETQTVTPSSSGLVNVRLGTTVPLPALNFSLHKFLQVEVKSALLPNAHLQLMDPTGDAGADAVDRKPIDAVAYALNADAIQGRSPGTASGELLLLGPEGKISIAQMGSGTTAFNFGINALNGAGDSLLTFGNAVLAETLKLSAQAHRFEFSTSVYIHGDLTVTGQIHGSIAQAGPALPLAVAAESGLSIRIASGSYSLNGALVHFSGSSGILIANDATNYVAFTTQGIEVSTVGFPALRSFIPLAQVTTSNGSILSVNDTRTFLTDARESETSLALHPPFSGASVQADDTSNIGQLAVTHDGASLRNHYLWTSEETTTQHYDIVVPISLPRGFARWRNDPITVAYRTTSAQPADSSIFIRVFDTGGQEVTVTGAANDLSSTVWEQTTLAFAGSPTWTPSGTLTMRISLRARNTYQAHLGDITLHFDALQ